jgi:hypothetical protein
MPSPKMPEHDNVVKRRALKASADQKHCDNK